MQTPLEVRRPSRYSGLARQYPSHGIRRDSRRSQRARETNLKLNKSKIKLRQPEVKFMGHVITNQSLKPDPVKVKAVDEMPGTTCKKERATLLGFVKYLSRFLPWLAEVTQVLTEL